MSLSRRDGNQSAIKIYFTALSFPDARYGTVIKWIGTSRDLSEIDMSIKQVSAE